MEKQSAEGKAQIICRDDGEKSPPNGLAARASRLDCNSTLAFDGNYSVIRFSHWPPPKEYS